MCGAFTCKHLGLYSHKFCLFCCLWKLYAPPLLGFSNDIYGWQMWPIEAPICGSLLALREGPETTCWPHGLEFNSWWKWLWSRTIGSAVHKILSAREAIFWKKCARWARQQGYTNAQVVNPPADHASKDQSIMSKWPGLHIFRSKSLLHGTVTWGVNTAPCDIDETNGRSRSRTQCTLTFWWTIDAGLHCWSCQWHSDPENSWKKTIHWPCSGCIPLVHWHGRNCHSGTCDGYPTATWSMLRNNAPKFHQNCVTSCHARLKWKLC